ncbi:hypothetical protein [Lyngbya sp. CCY1209]|uniref:hypothetical protein n=1 Tax=Lyngbya sp. CCY1209 TaxID=2886103 RepID=UPI002D20A7B6|nr:hypothetical protein [Lyngbya sp. CCY1209]MEB3882624.1 hypothetical protein [Lyngbya sp. CCY1209]
METISIARVRRHLHHWIETFLSVPHPNFGGLPPCPFSRKAWSENRVAIRDSAPIAPFNCDNLENTAIVAAERWGDDLDVFILVAPTDVADPQHLDRRIRDLNQILATFDLVALADCPRNPATTLSHTDTSNGRYTLVLIQKLSHLQTASDRLRETDYYKNWSEADFENIVNWRSHLVRRV